MEPYWSSQFGLTCELATEVFHSLLQIMDKDETGQIPNQTLVFFHQPPPNHYIVCFIFQLILTCSPIQTVTFTLG
ncbi:hypothetical protein BTVI_15352 [Pitangus sulphuratus]|nr:hypothetical protein BTVI_15352 [Pitangus sulphuratus]